MISGYRGLPRDGFGHQLLSISRVIGRCASLVTNVATHGPGLGILFAIDPVQRVHSKVRTGRLDGSALLLAVSHLRRLFPGRIFCFPTCRVMLSRLHSCQFCTSSVLRPSPLTIGCL